MKVEKSNNTFLRTTITIYFLLGLIAFSIRLYLNFSQELIPGVNGGYYPLQVRSILTNGLLGFSDMPLLFYFDAYLIKFITFFGLSLTDTLIMIVVKIVDSFSIPLLLIPLYKIIRLEGHKTPIIFETSIISFAVLSFSPLILTSDLQKNALAITFLFCFVAYLLSYLNNKRRFEMILSIVFLILTGLTHFGTFIIAVLFLVLIIGYIYKRKAIIPLSIVILIGLGLIAVFDITRLNRLFSVGALAFENSALLNKMLAPPDILIILVSIVLAVVGIIILKTKSSKLRLVQKAIIFACIVCLIFLSFPLLDGEYFKRLSLFLFIFQILFILQISSVISIKQHKAISISLFLFIFLSIFAVTGHPKETIIDKNAYKELKELKSVIRNDDETIVIARHGLEWWTAWALHTKVGQDKAIDSELFNKYKRIIFINQMSGFSDDSKNTPFHEPKIPRNSEMIFSAEYFKAFKWNNNQSLVSQF
ncbi:MAG: hypothetical protein ABFC90_01615 [Bacteroidales bacterium]|nr:hypothetical protein [Bacteroidales bacterium]MDD2612702.1 hypothetical protein [Bacteroidales bacterium]MDD4713204.1 hypothetical protein [Bacteroidales bacterium]